MLPALKQACVPDVRDVPALHDSGGDTLYDHGNDGNFYADSDGDSSRGSGNDGNDEPGDDAERYAKTPVWRMPRQLKTKSLLKWIKFS
jgi:hypothetical protein